MAIGFKIINAQLLDYGHITFCCYYFLGITVVSGELTMISFSIVFFLPLAFLLLCSLSAVSSSFYNFIHSSPTLSKSFLMQYSSQFRSSSSRPFPFTFWASALFASLSSPIFSTWHFLLSALLTPIIIHCFSQTWTFPCCFSVSAIASSAIIYAGVAHELSTFLLCLRDMRLSPITLSTFLQAFAPALIIVIKAIYLVGFALGKCHFLSWIY